MNFLKIAASILAILSGVIGVFGNTIQGILGPGIHIIDEVHNHLLSSDALHFLSWVVIVFGLLSLKFPKSSGIMLVIVSTTLFVQGNLFPSPFIFIAGLLDLFAPSPNKFHNTKRSLRLYWVSYLVVFVLIAGTNMYVLHLWNMKPKTVEEVQGISITAEALTKEYGADEKAANAKYLNKAIEVSGTISGVTKNQDKESVVTLESGDPMAEVQCTMRDSTVNLTKGQNVVIKGFCGGNNLGVVLTRCIIK
jgi:tRNA_anti-like